MRPIDIIGLKNFRIFDGQAGFLQELSPINILTGANNSGKSSIIKSLQMLKNSSKGNQFPLHLDLNQQEHLLGDFDNVLYNRDDRDLVVSLPFTFLGLTNLYISLKYTVPTSKNTFRASLRAIDVVDKLDEKIVFSFAYRQASDQERKAHKIKHEEERKELQEKREENPPVKGDIPSFSSFGLYQPYNPLEGYVEWYMNLEKLKVYLVHLKEFYLKYLEERRGWIGLDKIDELIEGAHFIPSVLVSSLEQDVDADSWNEFLDNRIGDRKEEKGMEAVGQYDFDAEEVFSPPPQIEDVLYYYTSNIFRNKLIWNISEDSGTRSSIMENCFKKAWNALVQRINTVNYLSNIKEENSRIYNANINSPFIGLLKDYTFHGNLDKTFIRKYLKEFEIGNDIDIEYNPKYQLISVSIETFDSTKRELVDFGYGIKQLVLILIQISVLAEMSRRTVHEYDEEGETYKDYYDPTVLLVEEPESNLHPKWQSLLAEMFSEANRKFNIQLIIETHSEYLIRKFQTLVAKQQLSADKVKLFYLRNLHKVTDEKKQVESLSIQDDGSIDYTKFDGGFFEESTDLKLSLLNIQRDNFLKEFEDLKSSSDENENKISDLQLKIDEYTDKVNLDIYGQVIDGLFDTAKLSAISVQYLVSGQFLLNNIDRHDDFSPVILQYGRTVENELLQIFTMINPTKRWSLGAMQAALEKVLTGTSTSPIALRGSTAAERTQLSAILASTFTVIANLRVDLLEDLRDIRNMAGHPGHTKMRQDALDYIQDANDFLDQWTDEKI